MDMAYNYQFQYFYIDPNGVPRWDIHYVDAPQKLRLCQVEKIWQELVEEFEGYSFERVTLTLWGKNEIPEP
jgi:hypothetical protein